MATGRVKKNAASTIRADLYSQTKITDDKKIIAIQYSHTLMTGVIAS
jgi:hypothetical protein